MTCGALFCKLQGAADSLAYEKQPGSEILCGKDTGLLHPALHGVSTQKQSSDVPGVLLTGAILMRMFHPGVFQGHPQPHPRTAYNIGRFSSQWPHTAEKRKSAGE